MFSDACTGLKRPRKLYSSIYSAVRLTRPAAGVPTVSITRIRGNIVPWGDPESWNGMVVEFGVNYASYY
jgi:hypothetical protein